MSFINKFIIYNKHFNLHMIGGTMFIKSRDLQYFPENGDWFATGCAEYETTQIQIMIEFKLSLDCDLMEIIRVNDDKNQ